MSAEGNDLIATIRELTEKNAVLTTRDFDMKVGRIPIRGTLKTKRELLPK